MDIAEETPVDTWEGYLTLGAPDFICKQCGAIMWNMERNNKSNKNAAPTFSLCCKKGQVSLPPERQPPEPLASLLYFSKHFLLYIIVYNALFAMCSSGGKVDRAINKDGAPYCFKVRGQNLHFIGSLLPEEGENPKYCQLYIYDTENELSNIMNVIGQAGDHLDENIVESLMRMFHEHNKVVHQFFTARERFKNDAIDEYNLVFISSEAVNGRPNIIGPSDEVASLIVNSTLDTPGFRDTIVHTGNNNLKQVWETKFFYAVTISGTFST
ncbi:uncharacterized protein LOC141721294 isoform X1 [Apium graveolens]|uniref:uncharacterized protein LOC141721294 isoform X1 n=1 Tax=Apium graveolens TaxID=4045 RepID=UPI003D78C73D